MKWTSQRVIVTGGAGFIGSNLVDQLLSLGAEVLVVDKLQLSTGSLAWNKKLLRLESIFKKHGIEKIPLEICDLETDKQKFQILAKDFDVVFHLSALFGGRQFVDTRQADCSRMLAVDHNAIEASYDAGVERFHYSSSACFPAGTDVWTTHGRHGIEDIVAGDLVFDHLGHIGEVTNTSVREHHGPIKRIWISGLPDPIDATPEHPFLLDEDGKTVWKPAKEIRSGSRVLVPRIQTAAERPMLDLRPRMSEREVAYTKVKPMEGMTRQSAVLLTPGEGTRRASETVQGRDVRSTESTQSDFDERQGVDPLRRLEVDESDHSDSKYPEVRKLATEEGEWISRPVRKVEDIPFSGLVYNLECTPNHSYLVGDGVAVHNCVYPDSLQKDRHYLLKEDDILSTGEGWKSSDNLYGFAKLMGELQCIVFHKERGLKTSACRYLTVYGPGEFDTSHAIAALIERALDRADPYLVWGTGKQERGFTYVTDIAAGSIAAAEKVTDGTGVNLGWDKRYNMKEVAQMIHKITGLKSKMVFDTSKPEGPFSRALDISLAKKVLGWTPKVDLYEGLEKTIAWHKTLREGKT